MFTTVTERPRNVDALRAGALLYGDLGTSKAYVIGLAFAIAGYSSFWLIAAVSVLCVIIGLNYIVICRSFPNGGGVYASVRNRSEILSLVGAFFIIADYLITAALSGLSAFSYLQVNQPLYWTCGAIALIGLFNYFGPKHVGRHAFYVVLFTLACLILLALFSIPHLGTALKQLQPLHGGILKNWRDFVSIIVALSGVEAIANITGVMTLDPGSTMEAPAVGKTAKKSILWVIAEVAIFTSLFSLASMALQGVTVSEGQVFAPTGKPIRDEMLRYLGQVFVGSALGSQAGKIFAVVIGIALALLLLSAVNTALNGLIALQYLLSKDGELHASFQKLNRFGVPVFPLIIATAVPIIILLFVHNIPHLADLYAIGFVGAIATNLGATSTDRTLKLTFWERSSMFFACVIMVAIEITLFVEKPHARFYVLAIIVMGLILRGIAKERELKKPAAPLPEKVIPPPSGEKYAILCSVKAPGKALEYALRAAEQNNSPLYLLYIKEQGVISESDLQRHWEEDDEASFLFNWTRTQTPLKVFFVYAVSDASANTLVYYARTLQANLIILELSKRNVVQVFQGNFIKEVQRILPDEIELIVV